MCKNSNGANGNGRLTGKQEAFINAYLGDARYNATEAARIAGYDTDDCNTLASIGSENLTKPKIAEKIKQRLSESAMSADEVLRRLGEQARADHTQYLSTKGKVNLVALKKAGLMHLIKSTKWDKDGNLIVEFHSAQRALELIGKHHGLFTDIVEQKGEITLKVVYDGANSKA